MNERWRKLRRTIADMVYPEGVRLQNEAYFLHERYVKHRHIDRDTGISSDALLRSAIYGVPVAPADFPRDNADLGRCERMYDAAPPHLQRAMEPTLAAFRASVERRRP